MAESALKIPDNFDFPFTPYNIQYEFMSNLYKVIENKQLGIFESPTGTGKSLSIVCGAVRWLKDHNDRIRNHLIKKISTLEEEKAKIASESNDWLSSQAKEIEITRKLNELKLEHNMIMDYDKKILYLEDLSKQRAEFKKKKWNVQNRVNDLLEEITVDDNEDVLLKEPADDEVIDDEQDVNQKFEPVKIFICSRTHSQLSQFIGEIKKSPFGKDLRVVSLASRQNYCINPNVQALKSMVLMNESCLDMQKKVEKKSCDDGKVVKRQKATNCSCPYNKQQQIDDLKDWSLIEIQDIEDLVKSGRELRACPYYASRKAAQDAEVVLIPYNTLLHKATREANGIDLKDNVVIIDEAHNLLDALSQMYGSEINYNQIELSLLQLESYKKRFGARFSAINLLSLNQLIFVVKKLKQLFDKCEDEAKTEEIFTVENFVLTTQIDNYNMFKLVEFCKNSKIAHKIRSYAIKYPVEEKEPKKGIKEFLNSIENKPKQSQVQEINDREKKKPSTNCFLPIMSFLETLTYSYNDGRILIHRTTNKNECKLKFLLLNPSSTFSEIVKDARSIIVAGGTMKPINEFKQRLFLNAGAEIGRIVEFSCDHIIPDENILPIIVTKGVKNENLRFNYENRFLMGDSIKSIILECCKTVRGGIVVFFPSYKYENWVWDQMKKENFCREVFREPQNSNLVEAVLEKYANVIRKSPAKGALLFSVVGGKLSEGLNFSDDLGRCVIVIGMPYANIQSIELKEKMKHLDKTEGSNAGQNFYENLCLKAVNQCIGRAVRHRNDYATVLLVDERYNRTGTKNSLPAWIKRSLKTANFKETFQLIASFFKERN